MKSDLPKRQGPIPPDPTDYKWGLANPKRGVTYREAALSFIKQFPIETAMTPQEFDVWAESQGLLPTAPPREKDSDAWIAHTRRRAEILRHLNRAGPHPALTEAGETPFVVAVRQGGIYEVLSPREWINERTMVSRIRSLMHTKSRQLQWLMQAEEWDQLEPYERVMAEALYDDINLLGRTVNAHVDSLNRKFNRLSARLRMRVQDGRVTPRSPEMKPWLEPPTLTGTNELPPVDA